jgi:(S)-citramalyl-CoA lyase
MEGDKMRRPRSWLFTPANQPRRFAKGAEAGADAVVLDLEDAVPVAEKCAAREAALAFFAAKRSNFVAYGLRINRISTSSGIADLLALITSKGRPDFLLLSKVANAEEVATVDHIMGAAGLGIGFVAMVESAQGLANVEAIAMSSANLHGMMFGAADMAADIGAVAGWEPLAYARSRVVNACALKGLIAIDSPFFDLHDAGFLAVEAARAAAFGFAGKAAIHPDQLGEINRAFSPSAEDFEKAQAILKASENGVTVLDGKMVDEAMARRARQILRN